MKTFFFFITFLFLSPIQGTKQAYNFYLENQSIKYKKVFIVDSLNQSELISKLNAYLPTVSGLRNVQFNGDVFTGQIDKLIVNYKKYGGKWATTWTVLNYPMNGNLIVQVKDNKYRLIITDIEFISTYPYVVIDFDKDLTKKKGTILTTNKVALRGLEYLDKFLTDKFTITKRKVDNNW